MPEEFAIIDLFAGPGGLGEGFSQAGRDPGAPMKVRLSIEMDDHAIQTLRLRAFLRSFDEFPQEYHDALNRGSPLPDWADLYPTNWKLACWESPASSKNLRSNLTGHARSITATQS